MSQNTLFLPSIVGVGYFVAVMKKETKTDFKCLLVQLCYECFKILVK